LKRFAGKHFVFFDLLVLFIGPAPFQWVMNANSLSHPDDVGHVGSKQGSYSALFEASSEALCRASILSEELHSHRPSLIGACRVEEEAHVVDSYTGTTPPRE